MPRRTFRYNKELDRMVEIDVDPASVFGSHGIQNEIEPFVSPVDGTVIKSRSHLRAYMAEKNLVPYEEAKTQKAELDRYAPKRDERAMRERLYEYVDRLVRTGRGPNQ